MKSKKISPELAAVLLKAANLRESSWDEEAHNMATPLVRKYKDFYGMSLYTACQVACETEPELLPVVFTLLDRDYQGSVEWAKARTQ